MRMTRPIAAALLLALAPIASAPPLYGQSTTEDPTTAMARARFKEGVEFYDKGEYEQARVSFLQAYALKKHPAVLLNLAWSCLKSGHALDADRYFKQFLAEGKDITEKQRADANDGLAQSRAKLGRIDVLAAAGTEVMVDGDRIGNAPLGEPVVVEVGAHMVKFKTPDGITDTQSISVMGGEKAVARFKAPTIAPAAVGPATLPPPAAPAPEASAPLPPPTPPTNRTSEETNRRTEHASTPEPAGGETGGPSIFAPPKSIGPVILFGAVAIAGFAGAGAFLYFKGQAQSKADQVAHDIMVKHGVCPPVTASDKMVFGSACSAWATDNSQVNDDATVGNVLVVVGALATTGAIVYWLLADKRDDAHSAAKPVLVPIVGPALGGLSLSGHF